MGTIILIKSIKILRISEKSNYLCNFDHLPHRWGPLRIYVRKILLTPIFLAEKFTLKQA